MSLTRRNNAIEIAGIIAQLSWSEDIKAEHLAESLQYNNLYDDGRCNAENSTISFGNGINISLAELDINDVENAIAYLKKL